jgi:integrase
MAKGEGRIFKRGNRWWCAFYERGKEHRESAGATEQEARDHLKMRLAEVLLGHYTPPDQARVKVGELLDAYLTHRKLAGRKDSAWMTSVIGRVKGMLGDWKVTEVTLPALERWAATKIGEGYARGTVKAWLNYLSAAFTRGRKLGLTTRTPDFPVIALDNVRKGFFEPVQFEAVCRCLPAPIVDVARFAYLTGWRKGEILGLSWAEVDRAAKLITLPGERTKTGKGRVLPLVGELEALIDQRWKARVVGTRLVPWVFHRQGDPIKSFHTAWQTACVEAGMPGKLFHDLRRTAVRDMVRAGVPKHTAKQTSGHRSDAIFDRYDIVDTRDQAVALDAVQGYRSRLLADSTRTVKALDQR